jgi:uncharacterized protein
VTTAELVDVLLSQSKIPVLVKPQAKATEILGVRDGMLHVAIKAPPIDGKANDVLLKFLSKQTGKNCELVAGASGKKKLIRCG